MVPTGPAGGGRRPECVLTVGDETVDDEKVVVHGGLSSMSGDG
jgi:hypothetical protein